MKTSTKWITAIAFNLLVGVGWFAMPPIVGSLNGCGAVEKLVGKPTWQHAALALETSLAATARIVDSAIHYKLLTDKQEARKIHAALKKIGEELDDVYRDVALGIIQKPDDRLGQLSAALEAIRARVEKYQVSL